MHCEKTLTLLNHLRINHKDQSALIKLQVNLAERRAMLFYLKREGKKTAHPAAAATTAASSESRKSLHQLNGKKYSERKYFRRERCREREREIS